MTNAGTPKAPDPDFAGMVDRFETAVIEGSVALAALLSGRRQGTKPEEAEIEAARSALLARYEEMRAALEWYGENARLCRLIHSEGDAGRNALSNDGGKLARATLAHSTLNQPPDPQGCDGHATEDPRP